jgi:prevent-host-death family protein
MDTLTTDKNGTIVVSALRARANFGKLLRRVEDERRSLIIEKRGTPKAVLLSIRDYVKLAAPELEVLRVIGEESERKGIRRGFRHQFLQLIKNNCYTVTPTRRPEVTSDPDDNVFLECADEARAGYLVTGNLKHFPRFWKKTKVITPREFSSLVAPHLIQ